MKLLASLATGHLCPAYSEYNLGPHLRVGVPLLSPPHWDLFKTTTWRPWEGTSTLGPMVEARNADSWAFFQANALDPMVATGDSAVDHPVDNTTLSNLGWLANSPAYSAQSWDLSFCSALESGLWQENFKPLKSTSFLSHSEVGSDVVGWVVFSVWPCARCRGGARWHKRCVKVSWRVLSQPLLHGARMMLPDLPSLMETKQSPTDTLGLPT